MKESLNVKRIRKKLKMNQSDFAKICGLSRVYISILENGKVNNPGVKTIEKIKKSVINYIFLDWMFGIPNTKLRKGNYMKEKSKIEKLKEVVIDRLIENKLTDIELQINVLLLKIILDNEFK